MPFARELAVFAKTYFWSKDKAIGLPFARELAVFDKAYFWSKSKAIGLPFSPESAVFLKELIFTFNKLTFSTTIDSFRKSQFFC